LEEVNWNVYVTICFILNFGLHNNLYDFEIVSMLLKKYNCAIKGHETTKLAYDGLTNSLDEAKLNEWRVAEQKAMSERGEYLRIYEVQEKKGATVVDIIFFKILK